MNKIIRVCGNGMPVALFRRQIKVTVITGTRNLTKTTHPDYNTRENAKNFRKDFDVKKNPFKWYHHWFSKTKHLLTDNSKLIVIDSPVGIDRLPFAKKLAEWYDMKIIEDVTPDDIFTINKGTPGQYDLRLFNERLPRRLQYLDFEMLYSSKTLEDARPFVRTQFSLMMERMNNYNYAVSHVLNTGQGVIMLRNWFSDLCFTKALLKMKVFHKEDHEAYMKLVRKPAEEILKPHLLINLDAPVDFCMEQIKKRGRPHEQNSIILTKDFLKTYSETYQNYVVQLHKDDSIVLEYNMSNMPDWEYIEETFDELQLTGPLPGDEYRFHRWEPDLESGFNALKMEHSTAYKWEDSPDVMPELFTEIKGIREISGLDYQIVNEVVNKHPAVKYGKSYDPKYHGDEHGLKVE